MMADGFSQFVRNGEERGAKRKLELAYNISGPGSFILDHSLDRSCTLVLHSRLEGLVKLDGRREHASKRVGPPYRPVSAHT